MKQLAAVEAMALLLRDRQLRGRFATDRATILEELGVAPSQTDYFYDLELRQLQVQADSLIRKRRAEVARLIPQTWKRLGSNAASRFQQYVDQATWPAGHRRHFVDAANFCQFLRTQSASEFLASECHWVTFLANGRTVSVRLVRDLIVQGSERWAVQFCIRCQGLPVGRAVHLRGWLAAADR